MKISVLCTAFITVVSSQMIQPTAGTKWKIGQSVTVSFKPGQTGETVSLFFQQDRSTSLGGGPISHGGSFTFTVPASAINPAGGTSELVAVHRVDRHLQSVDSVQVEIIK
ncbi:unnamed protein product [Mucor hiemalis]